MGFKADEVVANFDDAKTIAAQDNNGLLENDEYKEPFPFAFSVYDKDISSKSLEIIKLTAQWVARDNDGEFLKTLNEKYGDNPQFDFLKEGHKLNGVLKSFLNQYKRIMNGDDDEVISALTSISPDNGKREFLDRCFQRAEYYEHLKETEQLDKDLERLKAVQYAAFDWDNFKIIAEITFDEEENYEQPLEFSQLKIKRLSTGDNEAVRIFDRATVINKSKATNSEDEEESTKTNKSKRKMKIRPAGETRLKRQKQANSATSNQMDSKQKMVQCPLTKKMIPDTKFDKHLRKLLRDPKYQQEKEEFEAQHKLTNLTSEDAYENIKRLARRLK